MARKADKATSARRVKRVLELLEGFVSAGEIVETLSEEEGIGESMAWKYHQKALDLYKIEDASWIRDSKVATLKRYQTLYEKAVVDRDWSTASKINAMRDKLLGLFAPERIETTNKTELSLSSLDEAIEQMSTVKKSK